MNQQEAESLVVQLEVVAAEPTKDLRRVALSDIIDSADDVQMGYLSLVLSFQFEEIYICPAPKFNTKPYISLGDAMGVWLSSQTKTTFHALPYLAQYLIYYMSSPKVLGLNISDLAEYHFTYIGVYDWILDNTIVALNKAPICPLCGTPNEGLCTSCINMLLTHTAFRSQDFALTLTPKVIQPPPKEHFGDFTISSDIFTITRNGLSEVVYTVRDDIAGYQPQLPILEYQTNLS